MRMMPRAAPSAMRDGARGAGVFVARLHVVGVQRAVQNNGKVKSGPINTWFVKNLQYVLSTVGFFLVFFLLSWFLRGTGLLVLFFVRVASRRLRSALASALDFAK